MRAPLLPLPSPLFLPLAVNPPAESGAEHLCDIISQGNESGSNYIESFHMHQSEANLAVLDQ